METIIAEIAKYTYIDKLFIWLGFSEELSSLFALIITSCIIYLLGYLGKTSFLRYKTRKASRDLAPYYNEYNVKRATKYFIPTNGQNISPTKEEEPAIGSKFITREKLIPFFIKNVFQGKRESDKFYLILADSGMGKTTFLINLYIKYNSIFNYKSSYDIKMLPFGDKDIIERIKDIASSQGKAKNTILLLDAFDEYKGLLPPKIPDGLTDDERFRKQLDEIFDMTRDFRTVIITSRTQYFPAQEENPYELNIPRFDKGGFHKLSKLYISPFNEKDIRKYLNKKFGILKIWNLKKKRNAKKITGDSHKLMVRPMLLSYIDYLVDKDRNYEKTFDIYDTLIKKWIEREGDKRKYDSASREKFKSDLLQFSKLVAIEIYKSGEYSKGIEREVANDILKQHDLSLEGYEITGQSLLTRDVAANWKFAHKSIYEFFIAEAAIENIHFGLHLDITSLDMTKKFIYEKNGENSSLNFFNHTHIDDNRYYLPSVTYNDALLIINECFFPQIPLKSISPKGLKGLFSLEEALDMDSRISNIPKSIAIDYCNKLNEKFGYTIRYNEEGVLVDERNNIIEQKKIKGFVFPTMKDVKLLLQKHTPEEELLQLTNGNIIKVKWNYSSQTSKIVVQIHYGYENKNLSIEEQTFYSLWTGWTVELLKYSKDKFYLDILGFKQESSAYSIQNDYRYLNLVYVDNYRT